MRSRCEVMYMDTPASPAPPPPVVQPLVGTDEATFLPRLAIATLSLGLVALVIYFLREFRNIFQPLFIAVFIGYILLPIHNWLVARGIRSVLAYVVMLVLILGALFGLGTMVYGNVDQLIKKIPEYNTKL